MNNSGRIEVVVQPFSMREKVVEGRMRGEIFSLTKDENLTRIETA